MKAFMRRRRLQGFPMHPRSGIAMLTLLIGISLVGVLISGLLLSAQPINHYPDPRNLSEVNKPGLENTVAPLGKEEWHNFVHAMKGRLRGGGVAKDELNQLLDLMNGFSQEQQGQIVRLFQGVTKDQQKTMEMMLQQLYSRATKPLSDNNFADRHIRLFLDIVNSKVCQNPVVDLEDPNYEARDAIHIFEKCRLLIFKNAFDKKLLAEYREQFAEFILGLKEGRISRTGTNSAGDTLFLAGRGRGRYEIVLPERLAHPAIVAHERILQVIRHKNIIGANAGLRSLQSLVSEGNRGGGTPAQSWHYDQGFLFGQERGGLNNFGIAGHDLPPAAVSLAIPFLDMTPERGPTEFCLGSSALNGVGPEVEVMDQSLIEEGSLFQRYYERDGYCPGECWIAPLLNFGDAVLWDYGVRHRGGWNSSPDLRSILLLVYSKKWFDDVNFGPKVREVRPGESAEMTELLARTRFAKPDQDEDKKPSSFKYAPIKTKDHQPPTPPLETIDSIYPNEKYPSEDKHDTVEYIATNWNVQGNPTLYINGVAQGYLAAKQSKIMQGTFGDVMELRLGSQVVGQFKCSGEGQFVFTTQHAAAS
ncbi:hypothetical protein ACA910_005609 [Epithemia clementina (nom. ined.)]